MVTVSSIQKELKRSYNQRNFIAETDFILKIL